MSAGPRPLPSPPSVVRPGGPVRHAPRGSEPIIPAIAALIVAALGAAAVFLGSWVVSGIAYVAVLGLGFVLIYLQRQLTNKAAIAGRKTRAMRMPFLERISIVAVLVACVINGVVIALHFSRFGFGG